MATTIMQAHTCPEIRRLSQGKVLTRQGERATELYLLLDGVLSVSVDGNDLAELGPGAIVGERAILEGGKRTSTLTTVTPVRVAVAEFRNRYDCIGSAVTRSPPRGRRNTQT